MMIWLDFICLLVLVALVAWLPAVGLLHLATRWLMSPNTQSRHLWLLASVPWLTMAAPLSAMCVVAAAKPLGWIADHCTHHETHHPHLCFEHWPAVEWHLVHLVGAATLAGLIVRILGSFLRQERQAARYTATLRALSHGHGRLRRLDIPDAFACSAGYQQQALFITRGLIDRLSYRERRIVLAHEVAHLRHRDPLRNLAFNILLLAHLPATARTLRARWRQAMEEQADDHVARQFGPEAVAGTLIKVARLGRPSLQGGLSAMGGRVLARIERLLYEPTGTTATRSSLSGTIGAAIFLGGVAAMVVTHHSIETLLGFLVGV